MIDIFEGQVRFTCDRCTAKQRSGEPKIDPAYKVMIDLGWSINTGESRDPYRHLCKSCNQSKMHWKNPAV